MADQPYRYLTLGNFFDDQHTQVIPSNFDKYQTSVADYYLIDDVYVAEAGIPSS